MWRGEGCRDNLILMLGLGGGGVKGRSFVIESPMRAAPKTGTTRSNALG